MRAAPSLLTLLTTSRAGASVASATCVVYAVMLCFLSLGEPLARAESDAKISELQEALRRTLPTGSRSYGSDPWAKLGKQIRVESRMASIQNGRIRLNVHPLRPLATIQALDLPQNIKAALGESLKAAAGRQSDLWRGQSIAQWIEECEIVIGEPVKSLRVYELNAVELLEAVHGYLIYLDDANAWGREGFADLNEYLRLRGPKCGPSSGFLDGASLRTSWTAELRNPRNWPAPPSSRTRPAHDRYRQRVQEFEFETKAKFEPMLARLVKQALLFRRNDAGRPLIEDLEKVGVFVNLELVKSSKMLEDLEFGLPQFGAPGVQERAIVGETGVTGANSGFSKVKVLKPLTVNSADSLSLVRVEAESLTRGVDNPSQRLTPDFGGFSAGTLRALALSHDSRLLAAAGDVIRIWDLRQGNLLATLRANQPTLRATGFRDVLFTPESRQIIASTQGTEYPLWVVDISDLSRVSHFFKLSGSGPTPELTRIALSENGLSLATADTAGNIYEWEWASGFLRNKWALPAPASTLQYLERELIASFPAKAANGGREMGIAKLTTDEIESVRLPDADDGILNRLRLLPLPEKKPVVFSEAFALAPSKDLCLIGGRSDRNNNDRTYNWCRAFTRTWQNGAGRIDYRNENNTVDHDYKLSACAISSDSKLCASGDARGLVQVWNPADGVVRHVFRPSVKASRSIAFKGDSYTEWVLGRNRYGDDQYVYNHYAPLEVSFNAATGILTPIEQEEPTSFASWAGYQIRAGGVLGELILVNEEGRELKEQFDVDREGELYSFGFHTIDALPLKFGAVASIANGMTVCFDPKTFRPLRYFSGHTKGVWAAASSLDGKRLITAGEDGLINVWSLENFQVRYNCPVSVGPNREILRIASGTPASSQLARGDRIDKIGGLTPLEWLESPRSLEKPPGPVDVLVNRGGRPQIVPVTLEPWGDVVKPLVSGAISPDGRQWLLWTEGGYYNASPSALGMLGWSSSLPRDGLAAYLTGAQAIDARHRPEVVSLTLKLGDEGEALRRLAMNIGAPQGFGANAAPLPIPPKMQFLKPKPGEKVWRIAEDFMDIEVLALAPDDQAVNIEIVTGEVTRSRNLGDASTPTVQLPKAPPGFKYTYHATRIALRAGMNRIQAIGRSGEVSSDPSDCELYVERIRDRQEGGGDARPVLHWWGVAVDDYKNARWKNLLCAKNDVQRVAEALKRRRNGNPNRFPYSDVKIDSLVNEKADRKGIVSLIASLTNGQSGSPQSGDTVALHICAHGGLLDGGGGYAVVPFGGDLANPLQTCVTWSDFAFLANRLGNRNIRLLLVMDTCHAGGLGSQPGGTALLLLQNLRGVVFAACGPSQTAGENLRLGHGLFSLALCEALTGQTLVKDIPVGKPATADINGDGAIGFRELDLFLESRVKQLTGDSQCPQAAVPQGIPDTPLF